MTSIAMFAEPSAPRVTANGHQFGRSGGVVPDGETIVEVIAAVLRRHRGTAFLHLLDNAGAETSYTYGDLVDLAEWWVGHYRASGLGPGAKIVVIIPHGIDLYAAYLGALLAGCVPAMFAFPSAKHSEAEYRLTIDKLVANVEPSLVVVSAELDAVLRAALSARHARLLCCVPAHRATTSEPTPWHTGTPSDTAFIQFSSGTTGLKKGVEISHRALLWQVRTYAGAIGLAPKDVIVSWLPLYHDMGLICCFFLPLLSGVRLVAMSPFDWVKRPRMLLDAVSRHAATLCWLPNFAYSFLAKNANLTSPVDLSSLRGVVNCSEPVMAQSHRAFLEAFRGCGLDDTALAASYAMAETTFAITSGGFGTPLRMDSISASVLRNEARAEPVAIDSPDAKRLVSSGVALPQTEIFIVGAAGNLLAERHVGQIVVRSPSVLARYHRNVDATAAAIVGDKLLTGDMGYLADGHLFVTGRLKDLIIVAGKNIFPQDVEDIACSMPDVIPGRAAAFGITDLESGTERLVVVAESHKHAAPDRIALANAIRSNVTTQCGTAPFDVRIVEPRWLQKATSGKIARSAARERYLALAPPAGGTAVAGDDGGEPDRFDGLPDKLALQLVKRCVTKAVQASGKGVIELGDDTSMITSGMIDSLTLVALIVELEKAIGMKIPPGLLDVRHYNTPRSILAVLRRLRAEGEATKLILDDATVRQIDDRDKACQALLQQGGTADLLVLGSSRVQALSPDVGAEFGFRVLNLWVGDARAEDWYCLLQYALQHHRRPLRAVVIGVDVEAFTNTRGPDQRLQNSITLARYLDPVDQLATVEQGLPRVVEDDRFDQILRQYRLGLAQPWLWSRAGEPLRTRRYIDARQPAIEPRVPVSLLDDEDQHAVYTLRMANHTQLCPRRKQYFERLVQLCKERGIAVVTFATQLHGGLHRYLSETTPYGVRLEEVRQYMQSHTAHGVSYLHVPTVADFGGAPDDFSDSAHIGVWNADILFRRLLNRALFQTTAPHWARLATSTRPVSILVDEVREASAAAAGQTYRALGIAKPNCDQPTGIGPSTPETGRQRADWNECLRSATGEFVTFYSGGTTWHPEKVARQAALLDAHPGLAGVITDWSIGAELRDVAMASLKEFGRGLSGDILPALVLGTPIVPDLVMLRTNFAKSLKPLRPDLGALAWPAWLMSAAASGGRFAFIEEPLVTLDACEPLRCYRDVERWQAMIREAALQEPQMNEVVLRTLQQEHHAALSMSRALAATAVRSSNGDNRNAALAVPRERFSLLPHLDDAEMLEGSVQQRERWEVLCDGQKHVCLMLHPPARISFTVPTGLRGRFTSAVRLHPDVVGKAPTLGTAFRVSIDGRVSQLLAIDPGTFAGDRTWHEVLLDVPENPNGAHSIELETRGLPQNDFRWALWRDPRFTIGATAHHGGVNMYSPR